jgi:hypothetical protein
MCCPSWQTRLLLKIYIFVIMEVGSLAMSAGATPTVIGPIWSSCMYTCILLPVLRFLCFAHMHSPSSSLDFYALHTWQTTILRQENVEIISVQKNVREKAKFDFDTIPFFLHSNTRVRYYKILACKVSSFYPRSSVTNYSSNSNWL